MEEEGIEEEEEEVEEEKDWFLSHTDAILSLSCFYYDNSLTHSLSRFLLVSFNESSLSVGSILSHTQNPFP